MYLNKMTSQTHTGRSRPDQICTAAQLSSARLGLGLSWAAGHRANLGECRKISRQLSQEMRPSILI